MDQNEGFVDTIINSIKYGLSNIGALLIGGIITIFAFFLIGLPFVLGYITKCIKSLLQGNNVMPDFEDIGMIAKDGIMVCILALVYGIVITCVMMVAYIPMIAGSIAESDALMFLGLLLFIPVFLVLFVLGLLFQISWIIYAATDSLGKAVNPITPLKLILANPIGFVIAFICTVIVGIASGIGGMFLITIPWVAFFGYAANAYIYTRFYQKTVGQCCMGTAAPGYMNA